eukprot:gnl/MRDRNA2_/MRDRNA2_34531_c0_seq1.p1 gnl/MRDRNA2_/MRDRNA2_34531_c0~~gnl/MRDRNA2_/MRDRNA2_34531_c0_seq1.p1  ORF type:complete len:384 (+),score=37.18 gnl/MRDRNA2_/MRDRNA2_34531_c0_seq1:64-1215(+)
MKPPNPSMLWKDGGFKEHPRWMVVMALIFLILASFHRSESETKVPRCEVLPVQGNLPFARLSGCDVKGFLEAGAQGAVRLRELMLKHGLLIFPDQYLTPAQEVAVSKIFGWHLEGAEMQSGWGNTTNKKYTMMPVLPGLPEVLCQGNAKLNDHYGLTTQLEMTLTHSNGGWHGDGIHAQQTDMPVLTSMYCLQAPERGGETHFACGRHAFASATPEVQKKARRLLVHYVFDADTFGQAVCPNGIRRISYDVYGGNGTVTGHKGGVHTVHPLVRKHPETGEESVYVSPCLLDYMEAPATETEPALYFDTEASFDFVEALIGGVTSSPLEYLHKWGERDFVIWDNRLTLHSAGEPTEMDGTRLHHRVRLSGSPSANLDLRQYSTL